MSTILKSSKRKSDDDDDHHRDDKDDDNQSMMMTTPLIPVAVLPSSSSSKKSRKSEKKSSSKKREEEEEEEKEEEKNDKTLLVSSSKKHKRQDNNENDDDDDDEDTEDVLSSRMAADFAKKQSSSKLNGTNLAKLLDKKKNGESTAELSRDLERGTSYDHKLYKEQVKQYGTSFENERKEFQHELELKYERDVLLKDRKRKKNEDGDGSASETSDSEEEETNKKKFKQYLKTQTKQFKKKRRKLEHREGTSELLKEQPDLVKSVEFDDEKQKKFERQQNEKKKASSTNEYVKPIQEQAQRLIPESYVVVENSATSATNNKKNNNEQPKGIEHNRYGTVIGSTHLFELNKTEKDRLERVKNVQLGDVGAFENSIKNVNFNPRDMSWLVDRLLHNKTVRTWIPKERITYLNKLANLMTFVTRKEEEEALRTCRNPNERRCVNEDECEGMKMVMPGMVPCILVEFLDFKDRSERDKPGGKLPKAVRPCVMCRRKIAQYTFVNFRRESNSAENSCFISYCNIPDVAGEYSSSQMIKTSSEQNQIVFGFVVVHHRKLYRQHKREGGWLQFTQDGYFEITAQMDSDAPFFL